MRGAKRECTRGGRKQTVVTEIARNRAVFHHTGSIPDDRIVFV